MTRPTFCISTGERWTTSSKKNRDGRTFPEIYATLILKKILTPYPTGYVDLQSPAGAGFGVVVYNYDGEVYASDEARMLAEMGDTGFRLV
jgi:hypothetical protein